MATSRSISKTKRGDHKANIIFAAITLFRRQGYAATGLQQILTQSGAPKGSLYHYFPGGKEQLAATAVRVAGTMVADTLTEIASEAVSFPDFLSRYLYMLAGWLEDSDFQDGCPIATVLLESVPGSELIADTGRSIIDDWLMIITGVLARDGLENPEQQARGVLAAVEGGLMLARVQRSTEYLLGLQSVLRRVGQEQVGEHMGEQM